MGLIGFALSGGAIYNALDARGRDAAAYEILDRCAGHPQQQGQYHYHDLSPCAELQTDANGHSTLVGYALDGFGIFGPLDVNGARVDNDALDECHGHVGPVEWDGRVVEMYHYHYNDEYPYAVGCFRGTPISVARGDFNQQPGAGPGAGPRSGSRIGPASGSGQGGPLDAVARELGVDADALRRAVGPPPPDFARAARALGVSEQRLREAFRKHRPR